MMAQQTFNKQTTYKLLFTKYFKYIARYNLFYIKPYIFVLIKPLL